MASCPTCRECKHCWPDGPPLCPWKLSKQQHLAHVVHVSTDQRTVYIGEEYDLTKYGTNIMGFQKAWKSCPIQSWSGGLKVADMPGDTPNKVVCWNFSHVSKVV